MVVFGPAAFSVDAREASGSVSVGRCCGVQSDEFPGQESNLHSVAMKSSKLLETLNDFTGHMLLRSSIFLEPLDRSALSMSHPVSWAFFQE